MKEFQVGSIVKIKSTDELPTKLDGSRGVIWSLNFLKKEGFHLVLAEKIGDTTILHESQMEIID